MYYNDENKQIDEFDTTSWAYFEEKTLFIYNPYILTWQKYIQNTSVTKKYAFMNWNDNLYNVCLRNNPSSIYVCNNVKYAHVVLVAIVMYA
jgi:bisphosphoglycerate-independent phosphoglycerate mutase (AlkP superfamily)